MKEKFENAEIEVVRFEENSDVITTSTADAGVGEGYDSGD